MTDRKNEELYEQIKRLQEELTAAREQIELLAEKNKELAELSITDELTGLYNQRHFHNGLEQTVAKYEELEDPLSLLFFDVDDLKTYNDTYGHIAGDDVLRAVAQSVLKNIRRETDSGYRYGGDEFAIILPGADAKRAVEIAKRINRGLRENGFHNVKLSFGIAELSPEMDSKALFRHADDAVYMAKRGRGVSFDAPKDKIYVYD